MAPLSVQRQVYESSLSRIFLEREDVLVPAGQVINAVSSGVYNAYGDFQDFPLGADTLCRVYFFHFDPEGTTQAFATGEMEFDRPILGVIGRSLTMQQTDGSLGSPDTLYPTNRFNRELEFYSRGNYDYFEISENRRRVSFRIKCSTDVDQFRVVLAPPCQADFTDDGFVNTIDFVQFLNAWANQDTRADVNGDGVVDTSDVIYFLNVWTEGC